MIIGSSTLGRYLAREIATAVAFVLVAFLALFAFFDFINELDDVGRAGYSLAAAAIYVLLTLPSRTYEVMPIAALIGSVYALAQLAAHSEFTAMRASGLSRTRALGELVRLGAWIAVFTALVGEALAPPAERLAQELRLSSLGSAVGGQLRSGLWIRDSLRDTAGDVQRIRFVNVGELMPDATLRRVRILEFDQQMRLSEVVRAERGEFSGPGVWQLSGVTTTLYHQVESDEPLPLLRTERASAATRNWTSELTPALLSVLMVMPERMSAINLFNYIRHLRENQQNTELHEIAFWKKVVYPLAVIVMMALALPFAYLQSRAGGIGYKVFAGIMLGVAFHFLNGLFSHLGLLNTWPPLVAVSIPSVVAFFCAVALLRWVDRTR
ncbi:MAG: LPS export ABC transporter permease LptG [Betaproteobacteria bacterium]